MPIHILTVDDSTTVINMVRFSLKKSDITCDAAKDGVEGLEKMCAASARPYDLVLVDINMPRMDGMEMLRQVRKRCSAYNQIPFIFLTTSSDSACKNEARSLGVKAWMKKPFSPEKLIEIIHRFTSSQA